MTSVRYNLSNVSTKKIQKRPIFKKDLSTKKTYFQKVFTVIGKQGKRHTDKQIEKIYQNSQITNQQKTDRISTIQHKLQFSKKRRRHYT